MRYLLIRIRPVTVFKHYLGVQIKDILINKCKTESTNVTYVVWWFHQTRYYCKV